MVFDSDAFEAAPLVIGVTAHRNLIDEEVPQIIPAIRKFFDELSTKFPHTPLTLLAPLAEGGGRLAAKVAIEMGVKLVIPLPLPIALYKEDFETSESIEEFESLCANGTVFELPVLDGNTLESISAPGLARNKQYAQLGIFLSSYSQVLLAIWDGKPSNALGGTAQVVDYHLTDVFPGLTDVEATVQQLLGRDENDLVYHIVCSRDQAEGLPAAPLEPLQTYWLTSDNELPSTTSLPRSNERVFVRMEEFNADSETRWSKISKHGNDLTDTDVVAPDRCLRIKNLFRTADWLADYYQRLVRMTFRSTYTLAAGMGLAFLAYADLPSQDYMIYVFLALFGVALLVYVFAQRGQWHRKYVDYRALAEGLRVQFYLQLAGISEGTGVRFAHANFLHKQDIELGWIRNVMRAVSIPCNFAPPTDRLDDAIRLWLNQKPTGQLPYYRGKAVECERLSSITRRIGMACLWSGIAAAIILAIFHNRLPDEARNPLIVLMGVLPLIAAVREAYAHKKADKELIRQYRFMEKLFSNAKRQLDHEHSDRKKKAILKTLGDAALEEHAEWILMHRERPIEHGKL